MEANYQEAFVKCGTTKGPFTIRLVRKWSPLGYDRAVSLLQRGFYDHSHFFRTVHGFLVQFGISYTEEDDLRHFADTTVRDDPQLDPPIPFDEGVVSYAGSGKDSRTSQLFIAYGKVKSLGKESWETPIGTVVEGMDSVRKFYGGYGDMPPWGKGPEQGRIRKDGIAYIEKSYPLLDHFESCIVEIIYPNLFDYDERDVKNAEEFQNLDPPTVQRVAKTTKNKDETIIRYLRKSSARSTNIVAFAVIFLAIAVFLLKRKTKGVEKTN